MDTSSADSATPHTGTNVLLHQHPAHSVEKDPEEELDCRQLVRAALNKVRQAFIVKQLKEMQSICHRDFQVFVSSAVKLKQIYSKRHKDIYYYLMLFCFFCFLLFSGCWSAGGYL